MTTLNQIVKSGSIPSGINYNTHLTLAKFTGKSRYNELQRMAARLYKRGLLKPFGPFAHGDTVVEVKGLLFALPPHRHMVKSTPQPKRIEEYLTTKRYELRNLLSCRLPRHRVETITPALRWEESILFYDHTSSRKYGKNIHGTLPTSMTKTIRWSTDDFIVVKKHPDYKDCGDGIKLCKVHGWWKRQLTPGENLMQEAFMAYNRAEATHSITQTENGAINGLKTRLTNKVLKTLS